MDILFRSMKLSLLALFLPFAFSLALHGQAGVRPPDGVQYVTSVEGISEYRLPNGLRVLLFPDPTKSTITVNVTYMVGSRHEQSGETGMAHLLEHLVFKGSTNHTDIKKELQDHGASPNGSTSFDRTNYFETFQATDENLNWALSMESDRMVNSFVSKEALDSEMTVVRNEHEAGENQPIQVLFGRVLSTAYLWHTYGNTVIGARSDIENVPIERLKAFYQHYYQPDNAILIVARKIDAQKTIGLVNKYFGPIPKPERQIRTTYTVEPTQDGERSVTLRRVGDIQALMAAYHVPAGMHQDFAAVDIAADILGDQPSGRLHKALVETGKATVTQAMAQSLKNPGFILSFVLMRQDQSMQEAENILLATLDNLKDNPFTEEEVARIKTQNDKQFELLMNNSERVALYLSEWYAKGDWRLLFWHRDRIKNVTRDEVQAAAEKYFVPSNRTIGRFIPEKESLRAEITAAPDVESLVGSYKSDVVIAQGEEFEATIENIENRVIRTTLAGGQKAEFLAKKTRGGNVVARLIMQFGNENTLKGRNAVAAGTVGSMLMRGTLNRTRQQINDEFDRLKANVNIFGGYSNATAMITTTQENLKAVLDLVVEIFKEPAFLQSEFDELVAESLTMMENQKSDPMAIASSAMQRHMSPYPKGDIRYQPTIEEGIENMKALRLDDVKAFYKDFYGASNARVVFVGDFDPEVVKSQLNESFANWKSSSQYKRLANPFKKLKPTAQAMQTPDKPNAMWIAGATFKMTDTDPDYPAIALVSHIFASGGMNNRLFATIRDRDGLSYGVGGQISASAGDDNGAIMAFAICAPQNAPKVEKVFKEELAKMLKEGFSAEEVEAAKKSYVQQRLVSRGQDGALASLLSQWSYWGRTLQFNADFEKKIMALTPDQMLKAAKKHIDPSQLSFFRAGDFAKAEVTW